MEGEKVVLRPLRDADADPLAVPFRDDPELGGLIGFDIDPTPESFRHFWKGNEEAQRKGEWFGRAMAEPARDEPMGIINLYGLDTTHRRCELGVWLVPAARGRGIATDAMRVLCGCNAVCSLLREELA